MAHRIDHPTRAIDLLGSGKDGWTYGEPDVDPPTEMTDDFLNDAQENYCRAIEAEGLSLVKGTPGAPAGYDQLADAIRIGRVKQALSNWTREANSGPDPMRAVAHNGLLFLAVGDAGAAYTLDDNPADTMLAPPTWTSQTTGSSENLLDIVWTGSLFVAVGANGEVVTSPDGSTWTVQTSGTALNLYCVAWNGSLLVAAGDNGAIITSPDGVTWTTRTPAVTEDFRGVAWSSTLSTWMLASEEDGGVSGQIQKSADGVTWTAHSAPAGIDNLRACRWINDRFAVVGEATGSTNLLTAVSEDGSTWTVGTEVGAAVGAGGGNADFLYVDGVYLVVGGGTFVGVDGLAWGTPRRVYAAGAGYCRSCYAGDRVLIPSNEGVVSSLRLGL